MTKEGFAKALRAFAKRTPFRPFVIELVTGREIPIQHPEALAFHGSVGVHFDTEGEITLLDHDGVCSVHETRQSSPAES